MTSTLKSIILEEIQNYLGLVKLTENEFQSKLSDLEIDSFGRIELIIKLEQKLNTEIPVTITDSHLEITLKEFIDRLIKIL